MVYRALCVAMAVLVVLTGCATTPATTPTTPTTAAKATTAAETPKPGAASPTAAAAPTKPAATSPSGTLVVGIANFGEDVLDPILGSPSNVPSGPIFEAAVLFDAKGNIAPSVINSWTLSPDGKVWTFKITKGIKFHNGDDLTSADVKFSLERSMLTKSRNPWTPVYRRIVDMIDAPNADTVTVTTKDVDTSFLASMNGLLIMPKKYIEEKGEDNFGRNPVGTAPWKFVSHTQGNSVEYEAVNNHWRITPAFQKLTLKLVPEESTRMAMLKRGELDIVDISVDSVDEVKSAGLDLRYGTYVYQPRALIPGTWQNTGQPVMDIKIRQALALAVNREEMAQTFFKGLGSPAARWATSTYSWAYDPNWKADPYDPQKAKQLLADAGYPNKFSDPVINMYAANQPGVGWLAQWMQIMSGYWEAVGVRTKITPIDNAAMRSMVATRPPDPKIVGSAFNNAVVPSFNTIGILWNGYGSTGIYSLAQDPNWDVLYANILKELDDNKRVERFREAQNVGHDMYVDISTVDVKQVYAISKKVGEWTMLATRTAEIYEGVKQK